MLDLGFVSAILADVSLEEVLKFAQEHRFKCVEIMCWPHGKAERRYAGVTHIDVDTLTDKKVKEIHALLEKYNIYISGLGYYPNPLTSDKKQSDFFIAHINKVIKAAALLGIPVVNTFIGRDHTKNLEDNFTLFEKQKSPIKYLPPKK